MSLAIKKIHISRDVIFHEHVFPFALSTENPSFPSVLKSFSSSDYADLDSYKGCVNDCDNVTDTTPPHISSHITQNPSISSSAPITSSTSSQHNPPTIVQRRSHRENEIPSHLKDYVINIPKLKSVNSNTQNTEINNNLSLTALFTKHHHISPEVIASTSQSLVENICHDSEPSSYEEASLNPAWQKAMI